MQEQDAGQPQGDGSTTSATIGTGLSFEKPPRRPKVNWQEKDLVFIDFFLSFSFFL